MKNYIKKEINLLNKKVKKANINKMKKQIKNYYKQNLKTEIGIPETIKRINNMKKIDIYYEYILCLYELPF